MDNRCPKCGSIDVSVRYERLWRGDECLRKSCGNCHYAWSAPTLDSQREGE